MKDINNPDKKRILVIDDNIQIHQDFKKVLLISKEEENDLGKLEEALLGKTDDQQLEKYTIDCTSQGEEGLELVEESIRKKEPYALAFIDVRMPPGWDGIVTISKIWEICPEIQIVICTAYSDYSWEELFDKFGYTDKLIILKKPFDNIEVRQLTCALTKKWELNKIANLKLNELEEKVDERTKELNETKIKYQNLYDYAPDMYFSVSPEGVVLSVNKYGAEYLGYKPEELIGGSVWIVVYKEDLKETQKQVSEIFKKKLIKSELEFRKIRKNGSILWVHERTHLFLDDKGTPKELLVMCRDISDRKQIEQQLEISEEKYRTMIEHSNDMIWTLNEKGEFTYFNKRSEELTGYKSKEGFGKTFVPIILEEDLEMVQKVFMDTLAGNSNQYEVRIYDAEKKNILTLSVNTAPIFKDGKIVGSVSFGRDITKQKNAEKELTTHQEHRKLINKILSHDLTNNLSVARSALRLNKESPETDLLDKASGSINKSIQLIKRMRDLESFVSFQRGLASFNVNNIVNKIVKNYPSVSYKITGKANVLADEAFSSVIDNIIGNAVIHSGTKKIDISIINKGKMCEIKIADYGVGIPDKIKNKIFEEGFVSGNTGHSGLGLFIAKKTLEKYSADIFVEDNKPKGSIFILILRRV